MCSSTTPTKSWRFHQWPDSLERRGRLLLRTSGLLSCKAWTSHTRLCRQILPGCWEVLHSRCPGPNSSIVHFSLANMLPCQRKHFLYLLFAFWCQLLVSALSHHMSVHTWLNCASSLSDISSVYWWRCCKLLEDWWALPVFVGIFCEFPVIVDIPHQFPPTPPETSAWTLQCCSLFSEEDSSTRLFTHGLLLLRPLRFHQATTSNAISQKTSNYSLIVNTAGH